MTGRGTKKAGMSTRMLRRMRQRSRFLFLAMLLLSCVPRSLQGQEPLWEEFQRRLKSDVASFGALFQFIGDFQDTRTFPGENGFHVENFRFVVSGGLDRGVDYLLVSNFGGLLDARVGFRLHRAITLDWGRFKTPYSRELLTGAGDLDFTSRSQSVVALAPGRALGVNARGLLAYDVSYAVGFFNAAGDAGGNARGRYKGAGRLSWSPGGFELGLNAAWNGDRRSLADSEEPDFTSLRTVVGSDIRVEGELWRIAAEIHVGAGQADTPREPWGGFATLGSRIGSRDTVLLRLDHYEPGWAADRRTLLIAGWNHSPTSATQIQVNAVLPVRGFEEEPRVLVNVELAL